MSLLSYFSVSFEVHCKNFELDTFVHNNGALKAFFYYLYYVTYEVMELNSILKFEMCGDKLNFWPQTTDD